MSWVESNIRACQLERYRDAVNLQGFAFIDLRTPPGSLPLGDDDERMLLLPSAEMFGDDRHEATQDVLDGKRKAWCL